MIQTISLAVLVLLLGKFLVNKFPVLQKYCIPTPVVGGLVFAIVALILRQTNVLAIEFDTTLQDVAMNAFFTSVGFGASIKVLKKGGKKVIVFLGAAVGLVVLQDVLGVGLASTLGLHPYIGLATGSVPMTGGHGTAAAFGPVLEEAGAAGANTIAIAAATFGLVSGSMMGGPVANRLIIKYNLTSKKENDFKATKELEEIATAVEEAPKPLIENNFFIAAFELLIAMGIGTIFSMLFESLNFTLPGYIGAMIVGIIIRNIGEFTGKIPVPMEEIDVLGGIGLQLFLSMALMGLRLWELAELALQMIILVFAQALLVYLYANFITFRISGRDYDAAVLTAGHCGFGLGATPNGVANMTSVTEKWGPSPTAFFVLPIVGGMFIDFINAFIITIFMNIV